MKISKRAKEQIERKLAKDELLAYDGLRVGVRGGGCSGLIYDISMSERKHNDISLDEDWPYAFADIKSEQYLRDCTLDFISELLSQRFEVINPNAVSTCGCGKSFQL